MVLLDLNSTVSDSSILSLDVLSEINVYIRTVGSKQVFSALEKQLCLVYGPFWQSNMQI